MKNVWLLLGSMLIALPAGADEVPDDTEPVAEAPVEEAPPPEPVAEAPVEEAPVEEAVAEEPVEEREPRQFYVGADAGRLFVSFSDEGLKQQFGGTRFSSNFYRVRAGMRVFEVVGLEAHYGQGDDEDRPGRVTTDSLYGFYAVPTGTFMDVLEIAVPVGFSWVEVSNAAGASHSFERVSFGLNVELPFRAFAENAPDIRIGGGGMVYQAENHARAYGFHAGLRFDFKI